MINTKYTVAIEVAKSSDDVFKHVIDLTKWWPEEFTGENLKLNAEFVLKTGNGHYSKNKVIEFVPDKKVVWLVTGSKRQADNFDWTGTKMIFELSRKGGSTLIQFTYDGVVLENEQDRLVEICDFCIKNLLYNFIESFTTTIEVDKSPQDVFNSIKDVSGWWATNVTGHTQNLNDVFTVRFGKTFATIKNIEVIPNKKITWHVIESLVPLFKNEKQWNNTKMHWEISQDRHVTKIIFTHIGLTPETECYTDCVMGWSFFVKESLFKLITEGKGFPRTGITAYIFNEEIKYDGLLYYKKDPLPDYPDGHIFLDVKETNGEEVVSIYSAGAYRKETFDVQQLRGEYFMIIENESHNGNLTPLQDITETIK
jgi:hypothetical protein